MTKYHKLGNITNRNVFPTVLEAEKSKIRGQQTLCLVEVFLLHGWWFSLCPHMVKREKEHHGLFYKCTHGSSNLLTSQRPHFLRP